MQKGAHISVQLKAFSPLCNLPYDLSIPPLGIYPEKTNTLIQKDRCTLMLILALLVGHCIFTATRFLRASYIHSISWVFEDPWDFF